MGSHTEEFYAIIPTFCFPAFCWSAIPTPRYIFNAFYSCSCHFFSSRCMLELRLAIYHRAAGLFSQASSVDVYALLAKESLTMQAYVQTPSQQWMTKPLLSSMHTDRTYQFSNLGNKCISLLCEWRKWCRKCSHSSSVTVFIKASKFTVWFFIYCVSTLSLHIESADSMLLSSSSQISLNTC